MKLSEALSIRERHELKKKIMAILLENQGYHSKLGGESIAQDISECIDEFEEKRG